LRRFRLNKELNMLTIQKPVAKSEPSRKSTPKGGLDYVNNYRHYRLLAHFARLLLYLGYSGRNVIVNVAKLVRTRRTGFRDVICNFRGESSRKYASLKTGRLGETATFARESAQAEMKRRLMDKMEGGCCAL
jgi:hypothetical protein